MIQKQIDQDLALRKSQDHWWEDSVDVCLSASPFYPTSNTFTESVSIDTNIIRVSAFQSSGRISSTVPQWVPDPCNLS